MKNLANLNSAEWCDIIFEGKNKSYGAYVLRQSSTRRHVAAFGIIILLVALVAALPGIVGTIKAATANTTGMAEDEVRTIVTVEQPKVQEPEVIKPEVPEPPTTKLAKSIKFAPPTIVENDQANDTDMVGMEEVVNAKDLKIGGFDVPEGSTDADAELKKFANQVMGPETTPQGQPKPPTTLKFAEIMPQFPGGEAEMYKYIYDNLKYPVVDQEVGLQGKVVLRFVVSKTGEISNIELLKGFSSNSDKEAMRVIKSMPRWIPGKQNGEPVQVFFTIPITFKLKK